MEGNQNGRGLPNESFAVEQSVSFEAAIQPGSQRQQNAMIKTINDVMPGRTMPKSHQCHRDDISHIRSSVAILEPFIFQRGEDEAVVNVIAEPERQTHVPAVPKVADVARKKRTVEIFRRMNTE